MITLDRIVVERILIDPKLSKIEIQNIKSGGDLNLNLEILIANTDRYQWLINKKKELLEEELMIPESPTRLQKIDGQIRQFKVDLLEYASTIYRLDDSVHPSVTIAREQLFKGRLANTDEIFDSANLLKAQQVSERLLTTRTNLIEVYQKLATNAEEFLVKAQLTLLNYEMANRFNQSVAFFEKSLVSVRRVKELPRRRVECITAVARFFQDYRHINQAIPLYDEAIEIAAEMTTEEPETYNYVLASIRNNLGALHFLREEYDEAISCHQLSLAYFEKEAEEGRPQYWIDVVMIMGSLANGWMKKGDMYQACYYFDLCLGLYDNPIYEFDDRNLSIKATGLSNAAIYYNKIKEGEKALTAAVDSVVCYRKLAKEGAPEMVRHLAISLTNLGLICAENGLIEQAEQHYSEALAIIRQLGQKDKERVIADLTGPLINIANLWIGIGKHDQAIALYQEAEENVRSMNARDPETFTTILRLLLTNYGTALQETGREEEAISVHNEAVAIARNLVTRIGSIRAPDLVAALIDRAVVNGRLGNDYPRILKDLDEAINVLTPMSIRSPMVHFPALATGHKLAGDVLKDMSLFEGSYDRYTRSLEIWQRLADKSPAVYLPKVANLHVGMAIVQDEIRKFESAFEHYKKSADIFRYLLTEHQPNHLSNMVTSYERAATVATKVNDPHLAISTYKTLLRVLKDAPIENEQLVVQQANAQTHFAVGKLLRDTGDVQETMMHLEVSLNIYKDLARDKGRDPWASKFSFVALFIGNTLAGCDLPDAAQPAYLDALAAARATVEEKSTVENMVNLSFIAANFAYFYTFSLPNEKHAISLVSEVLEHIIPLPEETDRRPSILSICFQVLEHWKRDPDDFVADVFRHLHKT